MVLLFIEVTVITEKHTVTPETSAYFSRLCLLWHYASGAVWQQSAEISGCSVCPQKDATTETPGLISVYLQSLGGRT